MTRWLGTGIIVAVLAASAASAEVVGWRKDGTGQFADATPPLTWGRTNDGNKTNIVWEAEMPSESCGSAIIVGERLFVTSNDYDLVCVEKRTGRILWVRTSAPYDAATAEDRAKAAEVFKQLDELAKKRDEINVRLPSTAPDAVWKLGAERRKIDAEMDKLIAQVEDPRFKRHAQEGYSNSTPTSDGESVYVWNGLGVLACYDLDGKRRWITQEMRPAIEHGFHSSPLLIDGKVIVFMRSYMAFDAKTGKKLWETEQLRENVATPTPFLLGGAAYFVSATGGIVRAQDGKVVFTGAWGVAASPIIGGGRVFGLTAEPNRWSANSYFSYEMPSALGDSVKPAVASMKCPEEVKSPQPSARSTYASPIYKDGVLYTVNSAAEFIVYDVAALSVLYIQKLDINATPMGARPYDTGIMSSLCLAGKYIYITCNEGTTIVIESGRTFKQVAKNKIERIIPKNWANLQEGCAATPFFEGNHMYLRAQRCLYCIGEPGKPFASSAAPKEKPKPAVAAPKPEPKAAEPREVAPMTDEQKARGLLSVAENYVRSGMKDLARKKLEELLDKYPGSEQAAEAKKKLVELGK